MSAIADTPAAPYYAVIFSSQRAGDDDAYAEMADRMTELAREQPGFLGVESVRGADGFGLTVSYWTDLPSIKAWRAHSEHQVARRFGRERWYSSFRVRVCRVERDDGAITR